MSDSSGGNHALEEAEATSYAPYENELITDSGRVQGMPNPDRCLY